MGPNPYKPECVYFGRGAHLERVADRYEKPTAEDIEKAKAAGISLPGWD